MSDHFRVALSGAGEPEDRGDAHEAVGDETSRESPEIVASSWSRIDSWACVALVLVAIVLVGLHVRTYTTLSPVDELQHIDYVIRAGDFDIPRRNERVGFEAMSEAACRSVDSPGYSGPPCGLETYDPADFQERGFNTAASQFPPYYTVTGVGARVLTATGLFESKVTAARMLGALWQGAAWCVVWYVMSLFGVSRRTRAVMIGLLTVTPLVIFHAGATVNPDVSLLLSGALLMLATVKFEEGRLRWWWLAAIYTGLFFVEATNILAMAVGLAYLAVRRGTDRSLPWRSRLTPLLTFPAIALLRLDVADRVRNVLFPAAPAATAADRLSSAPMFVDHRTDGVRWERVLAQLDITFTPVRPSYVYISSPFRSPISLAVGQLMNWFFIAVLVGGLLVATMSRRLRIWSILVVVALLSAGPFYTFYYAYFSGKDFGAPVRFALPLVPAMIVVVAAVADRTRSVLVAQGILLLALINTSYQLLTG